MLYFLKVKKSIGFIVTVAGSSMAEQENGRLLKKQ
jgi:hypothetical protein